MKWCNHTHKRIRNISSSYHFFLSFSYKTNQILLHTFVKLMHHFLGRQCMPRCGFFDEGCRVSFVVSGAELGWSKVLELGVFEGLEILAAASSFFLFFVGSIWVWFIGEMKLVGETLFGALKGRRRGTRKLGWMWEVLIACDIGQQWLEYWQLNGSKCQ